MYANEIYTDSKNLSNQIMLKILTYFNQDFNIYGETILLKIVGGPLFKNKLENGADLSCAKLRSRLVSYAS